MTDDIQSFVVSLLNEIKGVITSSLETSGLSEKQFQQIILSVTYTTLEDIDWMASQDPASMGAAYTGNTQLSAKGIMYYRIANEIFTNECIDDKFRKTISRQISERGKKETGIEIHPAAKIGRKFGIDHGYSTIIGETAEIGDCCILLNNVILGARDIEDDGISDKRHPTIMNNVTICGFVRILGPVTIGNNVFIGPYCTITNDVPDCSEVHIVDQLQTIKGLKNNTKNLWYCSKLQNQ